VKSVLLSGKRQNVASQVFRAHLTILFSWLLTWELTMYNLPLLFRFSDSALYILKMFLNIVLYLNPILYVMFIV